MSTVLNCFVEVKKDGIWVSPTDITFADKIYNNNWIMEYGGDVRDLLMSIQRNDKYTNGSVESILLDELRVVYTKAEPNKIAKKSCNILYKIKFPKFLSNFKNRLLNRLVSKAEGSDPWVGSYGFSTITLEDLYNEDNIAREKIIKEVEYYAQHNDLINAFYEVFGKKRDDEETIFSSEVLEYEELSAVNQLIGIVRAISQLSGEYYLDTDVRLVYWFSC